MHRGQRPGPGHNGTSCFKEKQIGGWVGGWALASGEGPRRPEARWAVLWCPFVQAALVSITGKQQQHYGKLHWAIISHISAAACRSPRRRSLPAPLPARWCL